MDDHEIVRRGLRTLLSAQADFDVCGEATDGRDGVQKARELNPDVIVMDISMPHLSGIEATRMIRKELPNTEIVILSQHDSPEMIREAFNSGARCYVSKAVMGQNLTTAITKAIRRERFVSEALEPLVHVDVQEVLQRSKVLEQALRESEKAKYHLAAIVDSSDDVIVSKNLDGIIQSWNGAAERLFGYSAAEAIGRPITIVIPPELHHEERQILERLRRGERIQHFETVRVTKAGKRLHVSLTISPIRDASGTVIGASKILRDVTDHKIAEALLREKESLLRAAFVQTYSFLCLLSLDGTILEANRAALDGTGYQRHEVVSKKIWDVWWAKLPEEQQAVKRSFANAVEGLAVREECSYAMRDGSIRFADRSFNPVLNEKGEVTIIVASGLDITEQRLTRTMLEDRVRERTRELELKNLELIKQADVVRELSGRLLQIQDEERRRIARELHDSVGQMLAAASMNTSHVLREAHALSSSAAAASRENAALLEQISTEIRTISHLLHPPLLDEIGLQSALQWYIDGFSERSKINISLELPEDFGRLPRDIELSLFRVVQESLTNIHRHSGSSTAFVRLTRSGNDVRLEVRDLGKGIAVETQVNITSGSLPGVGLRGMRERLRQLGGQLIVQSTPSGTTIVAQLPIAESVAREDLASSATTASMAN